MDKILQRLRSHAKQTGDLWLPVDDSTAGILLKALRAHRARQNADRLATGTRWVTTDLVFTTRRGTPIEPRTGSRSVSDDGVCSVRPGRRERSGRRVRPAAREARSLEPIEPNSATTCVGRTCVERYDQTRTTTQARWTQSGHVSSPG